MKGSRTQVGLLLLVFVFVVSCAHVPLTGRRQLTLIPTSTMLSMSFQQYGEFLSSHQISANRRQVEMVGKVGRGVQSAVESYFREEGMSSELAGYEWDFNLVESDEVNAWCMPGGKVVVYTGILPVTKTETGLAVVVGHEVAHAVARHGNERMSQLLIAQLGGMALSEALKKKPEKTRELWMTAYGVGAQLGAILPYSRLHEKEADRLGLIFMAMAGYDPNEAVAFWQRMAQMKGGAAPPEFLSTHPSDETRIREIRRSLPEALQYYRVP